MNETPLQEQNVARLIARWADPIDAGRTREMCERFLAGLRAEPRTPSARRWGARLVGMAAAILGCAAALWLIVRPAAPPGTFAQEPPQQRAHVVQAGETLSIIAARHYGDKSAWRAIADANRDVDPFDLKPGQVLRLPVTGQEAKKPRVVDVRTPEELLAAIGSDTTIRLAPGTYNLSKVAFSKAERWKLTNVDWTDANDGEQITFFKVRDLTIEGSTAGVSEIVVEPRWAYVLNFRDAEGITLKNCILGHTLKGYCTGGVVQMERSERIRIEGCDLYGCGTEGLTLSRVKGFVFEKSRIRDCSYGIARLSRCSEVRFVDSRFENNREYYGFRIFDGSTDISITRCIIRGNEAKGTTGQASDAPLFDAEQTSGVHSSVTLENCTVIDNTAGRLASAGVTLRDCDVRDNDFR